MKISKQKQILIRKCFLLAFVISCFLFATILLILRLDEDRKQKIYLTRINLAVESLRDSSTSKKAFESLLNPVTEAPLPGLSATTIIYLQLLKRWLLRSIPALVFLYILLNLFWHLKLKQVRSSKPE